MIWPGKRELEERFRCWFLAFLEGAGRLSSSFHSTLLSWRHTGFPVDATQRVAAGERGRLGRWVLVGTEIASQRQIPASLGGRIPADASPFRCQIRRAEFASLERRGERASDRSSRGLPPLFSISVAEPSFAAIIPHAMKPRAIHRLTNLSLRSLRSRHTYS